MRSSHAITRRTFLTSALCAAGTIGLAGCGAGSSAGSGSAESKDAKKEQEKELPKHVLGDTVETDLVKLTLDDACFAIALENSIDSYDGINVNWAYGSGYSDLAYFTPKEYDPERDKDNPYCAPKGEVLVYAEMTFECLDRDHLEIDESSGDSFATLRYDGSDYTVADDSSDRPNKLYGIESDAEENWEQQSVPNLLLSPASTEIIRAYYCYPIEPESLDDPFELLFTLPASDDKSETFRFVIDGK